MGLTKEKREPYLSSMTPTRRHIPPVEGCFASVGGQHATAYLVALDRLEQGLEVAFTEATVAFTLNELKEHGAEQCFRENLQQQAALAAFRRAVEKDAPRTQLFNRLAVV